VDIEVICKYCGKTFLKEKRYYNSNLKLGLNFYCSKDCVSNSHKTGSKGTCDNCGKEIYILPSVRKKNKGNKYYCSRSCAVACNRLDLILPEFKSIKKQIFDNYKRSAKKRELEFELTQDRVEFLIQQPCYFCGELPINGNSRFQILKEGSEIFKYNGIDRLDNIIGYTEENSITACWFCNRAKFVSSEKQYYENIERTYNHGKKLGKIK